eukprot:1095720-Pleurochrysis_carterae.AAC.2
MEVRRRQAEPLRIRRNGPAVTGVSAEKTALLLTPPATWGRGAPGLWDKRLYKAVQRARLAPARASTHNARASAEENTTKEVAPFQSLEAKH